MSNLSAVDSFTLLNAFHGFFALQLVGFLATAEAVNKESQLIHIFNAIGNNHLLVNQIGLRQICSSLDVDEQLQEVFRWHHN